MPGHHQDVEYSPNPIYIYETVQLEPPPPSTFFPKSRKYLYLSTYAGAPSRCRILTKSYIYIYIRNRTVRTPPKRLKFYSKFYDLYRIWWVFSILMVPRHKLIDINISLILEKTLMVGGGSNCAVSYIYRIWWVFSILMVPRHKLIHTNISLILEKTLMVGGVLTVRFRIYI